MNKTLTASIVFLGKTPKKSYSRPGFIDDQKQVYLPPKSAKRVEAWKKEMESKGFVFTS